VFVVVTEAEELWLVVVEVCAWAATVTTAVKRSVRRSDVCFFIAWFLEVTGWMGTRAYARREESDSSLLPRT
jgi:hypothetical protein